jgi:5-methylcytosine-specific restriction protein B
MAKQPPPFLVLQQMQDNSEYDDRIGEKYHFPIKKELKKMTGSQFIYYDPNTQEYFGRGRVASVVALSDGKHSDAHLENYQVFPKKVPMRDEHGDKREAGPHFNSQNSIRRITAGTFAAICTAGGLPTTGGGIAYTLDDAAAELFMPRPRIEHLLALLERKKNLILQGPPGVGKTFAARRLACALMGEKDPGRVTVVQFHQSYSYEDFIQGLRPAKDGKFHLKDGIFLEFCRRASGDLKRPYVFIIDEINRGQLAKIFGELMMLIEPDKRGAEHAIPLMYSDSRDKPFFIPPNIHFIGTMNTADRSLSLVDYALRRRFVFAELEPAFADPGFEKELARNGRPPSLIKKIQSNMGALNALIADDTRNLGRGYQIGHSFFCATKGEPEQWYDDVINFEVLPLLQEYWADQGKKYAKALEIIRS